MSFFYTNVSVSRSNILMRGYENGERVSRKIPYNPYLFVPSRVETGYTTILGQPVERKEFDTIPKAKQFLRNYSQVSNMPIYGLDKFEYTYIYDTFKGPVQYDASLLVISFLDIEVDIIDKPKFPDIKEADREVTLITISNKNHKHVFGCRDYKTDRTDVTYHKCSDEVELLNKFINFWDTLQPDVVTGWNIELFDIPYLVNRIIRILGERAAARLSPWRELRETNIFVRGKAEQVYNPVGVSIIDYLHAYKSFAFTPQESYSLDYVCQQELNEKKLDYGKYGSLAELQRQDWQMYTDYNIRDVDLVIRLDEKRKLLLQILSVAYVTKTNYIDAFRTVRSWDVLIHNHLMDNNQVIPPMNHKLSDRTIMGGYVKEPIPGRYRWVVSLDLNSLYPSIIIQYNISPDTYMGRVIPDCPVRVESIIHDKLSEYRELMERENVTITANMLKFARDRQGFLPIIMNLLYSQRVVMKNKMLEKSREFEKCKKEGLDPSLLDEMEKEVIQLDGQQQAFKILLNSGYGALANEGNRWHSTNFAESITSSGQATTRWIENKLNDYLNKSLKTDGIDYVIACDTDSVYLCLEEVVKKVFEDDSDTKKVVRYLDKMCKEVLEPYIDKCYGELAQIVNAYDQKMKMKRECIADTGIWTGKKHYILNVYNKEGVSYDKPKLKIMGIEAVRTSTPYVCRSAIKEALEIMMQSDEKTIQDYIDTFRQSFYKMPFEQVAFPRTVSNVASYADANSIFIKGTPVHSKGSLIYNHALSVFNLTSKYDVIGDHQKIRWAYLKTPNPLKGASVISCPDTLPPEFGLEPYIDYDQQFEKAFLKPVEQILNVIGWKSEETSSIRSFF